jgi:hypothetical protein
MKITCECGNEITFVPEKHEDKDNGQYVKYDSEKFYLWSQHGDEKGITCLKCNKAIWFY